MPASIVCGRSLRSCSFSVDETHVHAIRLPETRTRRPGGDRTAFAASTRFSIRPQLSGRIRLAERRRRVEPDRRGSREMIDEHDDRRHVRQHRQELRRDRRRRAPARRTARSCTPPNRYAPTSTRQRPPRREHDQRQRDPAAAGGHAFDPQRRVDHRKVRAADARPSRRRTASASSGCGSPDSRSHAPTAAIRRPRAARGPARCGTGTMRRQRTAPATDRRAGCGRTAACR